MNIVQDELDPNVPLWEWLYPQLTREFNGIKKPRVHFFQEDLAATRLSAAPDYIPYASPSPSATPMTTAYSFTPYHCSVPSFAYPCGGTSGDCTSEWFCSASQSVYNNGITFQANTAWSSPFSSGNKVTKTLNGTPNDGLEAAFNNYLSEYLEVYQDDTDHAKPKHGDPVPWDAPKWAAGLQSWHDYLSHLDTTAPLEAPAGLTVARGSATSNTVSWYGVYRATSYTLQSKSLRHQAVGRM